MHPILFKFGPFTMYSYGFFVALAFIITNFLIIRDSPGYGIPKDDAWDLLLFIFISGFIGARLLHVLLCFDFYKRSFIQILMVHKGGLAIQGAIIAAILVSILFLLKKRLPVWKAGDLIMGYLPLGQAIGRIGCFLNGCCYGKVTGSFLGVTFERQTQPRHPTQLYASIALLFIFVILKYLSRRNRHFDGEILLVYFLLYCPVRFLIDFLRGDLPLVLAGLTASQLVSAVLFFAALGIYCLKAKGVKS